MEQRPLRLGDILDDYCPRERRVTNHAIVAMIDDDVRQTRCTTCDTEHPYKGGKAPRRRKKETPSALYNEVLAGMGEPERTRILPPVSAPVAAPEGQAYEPEPAASAAAPSEPADAPADVVADASPVVEEGPVHRPLIRATLPRPEGQKEARPVPDFTMRQPLARGHFRQRGAHGANGNGNRPNGLPRFGGPRTGQGNRGPGRGAPSGGFRGGQPRQGGRKRSR